MYRDPSPTYQEWQTLLREGILMSKKTLQVTCDPEGRLERIPLGELNQFQGELKDLHKDAYDKLRRSFDEFGFAFPMFIWHGHKEILDGHQRLHVLNGEGYQVKGGIPVVSIVAKNKQEAAKRVLMISSQYGKITDEGLYEFTEKFEIPLVDFDLPELSDIDMENFLASYYEDLEIEDEKEVDLEADVVPEVPEDPTTKAGDIWILGDHRLLCGDTTNDDDVKRLMNGKTADMIFTDPPFAIYGSSTGLQSDVADDKMIRSFFRDIIKNCSAYIKPVGHVYICCDWRSWSSWWETAKGTGIVAKNMIVWDKITSGLGTMYRSSHELIFFASFQPSKDRMRVQNISEHKQRKITDTLNIWKIERINFGQETKDGEQKSHNAQKPVELVTTALENSSDPKDLVVDWFTGSGTTLIAAEKMDRVFYGMEIEPRYCDVIVKRWEELTGKTAELEQSKAA